jgi:hypothetical protein
MPTTIPPITPGILTYAITLSEYQANPKSSPASNEGAWDQQGDRTDWNDPYWVLLPTDASLDQRMCAIITIATRLGATVIPVGGGVIATIWVAVNAAVGTAIATNRVTVKAAVRTAGDSRVRGACVNRDHQSDCCEQRNESE